MSVSKTYIQNNLTIGLAHYNLSGVYMIKNIKNGDYYIGSSNNIGKRWNQHLNDLINGCHSNRYLTRAFNKHGDSSFVFGVIEQTTDLLVREQYYIDTLSPKYNLAKFATAGLRGMKLSKAHIQAISKANKGRKFTKEHIDKIKETKRLFKKPIVPNFWMNSVLKRIKPLIVWHNEVTPILYDSHTEAANALGVSLSSIAPSIKNNWLVKGCRIELC